MEAFTLGIAVSFYPNVIVLQALYGTCSDMCSLLLTLFQAHHNRRLSWLDLIYLPIQGMSQLILSRMALTWFPISSMTSKEWGPSCLEALSLFVRPIYIRLSIYRTHTN